MAGTSRGFHQRHIAFKLVGDVTALDGECPLPGVVCIGENEVSCPAAGLAVAEADVRDGEVVEPNRVDFGVEGDGLGTGRGFGQALEQAITKCRGAGRRVLGHHHDLALERAVLSSGRTYPQIVCEQGGGIGVAVFFGFDDEATGIVDPGQSLARIVGVLDDPAAGNLAGFIDPAEAEGATRAGRAGDFK